MEDVFDYVMNTPANTNPAVLKSELSKSGVGGAAVLYTEQELTDEQKAQARENIEVQGTYFGWEPVTYDIYISPTNKLTYTRYIIEGTLVPPDYATATEEVYTAWKRFNLTARNILFNASLYVQYLEYICTLSENGIFGENFINERKKLIFANFEESNGVATVYSKTTVYFFERDKKEVLYYGVYRPPYTTSQTFIYDPQDKKITAYAYYDTLFKRSEDANAKPWLSQILMQSAPTEDMHIATKKYVDDKISDKELILTSSTSDSTKKFKITVDDTGTLTATEVQS